MSDRPPQDCGEHGRPSPASAAATGSTGSLADMVEAERSPSFLEALPPRALVKAGLLAAALVAINHTQFPLLFFAWLDDPNWSHGFLIPLFSLYLLYSRRRELLSAERRVSLLGLPILILGAGLQVLAYWVHNPWSCQLSMLVVALGLVYYLCGRRMAWLTWLPILFLAFALPLPSIYYADLAYPLQNLAALVSTAILRLCGVAARVTESKLDLVSISGTARQLTVAEACSGMRLLMAFLALSVAMAYLENRPIWQRVILVAMGIPVAILCNVIRVTITSAMFVLDMPDMGQDFMHDFTGMLMLIPAFAILWLLGRLLQGLFVEVDEGEDASAGGASQEAQA